MRDFSSSDALDTCHFSNAVGLEAQASVLLEDTSCCPGSSLLAPGGEFTSGGCFALPWACGTDPRLSSLLLLGRGGPGSGVSRGVNANLALR